MAYKTILVHLEASRHAPAQQRFAAELAALHAAHLIGMTCTGLSRYLYQSLGPSMEPIDVAPWLGPLQDAAQARLRQFEAIAAQVGVSSVETRLSEDEPVGALSLQARYADLLVLGQYAAGGDIPAMDAALPELSAMHGATPVLVLPGGARAEPDPQRVLVGWNASAEAARAVRLAMPFLQRAKQVDLAVLDGAGDGEALGEAPGADIALCLARHGVQVVLHRRPAGNDAGAALLSLAAELQSQLLVMGCFGHSRFREMALGGASRTVLRAARVPVLIAH